MAETGWKNPVKVVNLWGLGILVEVLCRGWPWVSQQWPCCYKRITLSLYAHRVALISSLTLIIIHFSLSPPIPYRDSMPPLHSPVTGLRRALRRRHPQPPLSIATRVRQRPFSRLLPAPPSPPCCFSASAFACAWPLRRRRRLCPRFRRSKLFKVSKKPNTLYSLICYCLSYV